jgi:hypothetical protein
MIGFIEHFFTIAINYSAIDNLHNSLGHAPFLPLYSQLLLSFWIRFPYNRFGQTQRKTACIVDEASLPCYCLARDVVTRWSGKGVYQAVAYQWTSVIVVTRLSRKAFTKLLPSNAYPCYNILIIFRHIHSVVKLQEHSSCVCVVLVLVQSSTVCLSSTTCHSPAL